jgi:TatD DNase family protein
MIADAHCHLWDLSNHLPDAERERRNRGVVCAASAWNLRDFSYQADLRQKASADNAPRIYLCFGAHPQLPASPEQAQVSASLALLETLASCGRLDGIGETGFDLFDQTFRDTEAVQDRLFAAHLDLALSRGLPIVLHIRKAMHKVFACASELKKARSVIFHSYPGTLAEGEALLRRGINAYFSFGNPLALGRKESLRSCAGLPRDRLLAETDAPYQRLPGTAFSHWDDLPGIFQIMARIRQEAGHPLEDLQRITEENFYRAYNSGAV